MIQRELNEFVATWNARRVRQSASAPGGKANILFAMPRAFGFEDQGIRVSPNDIRVAEDVLGIKQHPVWIEKDIHELITCYLYIHNLDVPIDAEGACNLYTTTTKTSHAVNTAQRVSQCHASSFYHVSVQKVFSKFVLLLIGLV